MKTKILSLLLVLVMVVGVFALSSCSTEELDANIAAAKEEAIETSAKNAQDAVDELAQQFAADLADAVQNLRTAINDNNEGSIVRLTDAVNELNAAIANVQAGARAYTDEEAATLNAAIAAAKAEAIDAADAALTAAKAELNAAIALKADTATLNEKVDVLNAAIATAEATAKAYTDAAKADLVGQIATAKAEAIAAAKEALDNAVNTLNAAIALKADTATLNEKVDELNTAITNAQAAAEATAKGYTDGVLADAVTDLEGQIDAAKAEAIGAAQTALTNAVNTLNAAIALKADTATLNEKVDELNTAITNAQAAAEATAKGYTDGVLADAVADLEGQIATAKQEAIDAAQTALTNAVNTLIDAIAQKATKVELAAAVETLEGAIAIAQATAETTAKGYTDIELAAAVTELEGKIDAAKLYTDTEVLAALEKVVKLDEWNEMTEQLPAKEAALAAAFASYDPDFYSAVEYKKIVDAREKANIDIWRATSVAQADAALAEFKETSDAADTIPTEYYKALMALKDKLDEVEATAEEEGWAHDDVNAKLVEADALSADCATLKAIIAAAPLKVQAAATAYNVGEVLDLITVNANLDARLVSYWSRHMDGERLKAEMQKILDEDLVTLDPEFTAKVATLNGQYTTWVAAPHDPADVPGLVDVRAEFVTKVNDRITALLAAEAEAAAINGNLATLYSDIFAAYPPVGAHKTALATIKADMDTWEATYFSGDYAVELPDAEGEFGEDGSVNYQMLSHALYKDALDLCDARFAAFNEEVKGFIGAVNAICPVEDYATRATCIDLLVGEPIEAAINMYKELETKFGGAYLGTTVVDGVHTYVEYYEWIYNISKDYLTYRKTAYDAYLALPVVTEATIYNVAEIDAILDWYDTYGVKVDTEFDFGANGYLLEKPDIYVTAYDYAEIVQFKADYVTLNAAKVLETANVIALIDAIVTPVQIPLSNASIEAARDAYDAWLAGDNAPEGFATTQFAIDLMDLTYVVDTTDLTNAEADKFGLDYLAAELHMLIEAIDVNLVQPYFADDGERDTYIADIDMIELIKYPAFFMANGDYNGDEEVGYVITAEEFAKIDTARLFVRKYNAFKAIDQAFDDQILKVTDNMFVDSTERDAVQDAMTALKDEAKVAIDELTINDADYLDTLNDTRDLVVEQLRTIAITFDVYDLAVNAVKSSGLASAKKYALLINLNTAYLEEGGQLDQLVAVETVATAQNYWGFTYKSLNNLLAEELIEVTESDFRALMIGTYGFTNLEVDAILA